MKYATLIFSVFLACTCAFAQPTDYIAYYPFNNNANDESGNGNNGTVNGATPTTDRFGNANSAYSFSGAEYIELSLGDFYGGTSNASISIWYVADNHTISETLLGLGGSVQVFTNLENINAYAAIAGTGNTASAPAESNVWEHVVMTYESGSLKLFKNGVLVDDVSRGGNFDNAISSAFFIGAFNDTPAGSYFNGKIDDVAIYDRTLSSSEVQALFLEDAFITTWQTTSDNESITIPTTTGSYDYTVDWGDGTVISGYGGDASHTYATAGTYTVSIFGTFPQIFFNSGTEGQQTTKIQSVDQWGAIKWTSMSNAFEGCSNIRINATDAPDLSGVSSMFRMFFGAEALNDPVDHWDVSNVSLLSAVFEGALTFNQPLNSWNTGSATDMLAMLNGASSFNQDLSSWNVSLVTDMTNLLANTAFNQSLGAWDISSVTVMTGMLDNAPMSSLNYDATLEGWSMLDAGEAQIPTGLSPGVNGLTYCTATDARNTLQTTFSWTISGDSEECGIEDGLVIYYPFNGDDTDASGNGLNPSDNGGVLASDRFGNASSAYTFDGTGTAITVTDATAFDLAQLSYSSWFNLDDAAGDYTLIHFVGGFDIRFQGGELNLFNGSCDTQAFSGGSGAIGTGWHHVVFTFDDQSGFAFYLDGILLFDGALTGCTTIDVSELRIGYLDGANSSVISGSYDDIRLYSRVISASEVGDLYTENDYVVPRVATLSTSKGIQGTTVKVYGAGFDGSNLDVQFDGQSATLTRISSNLLTFDVPTTSPGFKTFTVTNEFGSSAAQDFYVQESNKRIVFGQENTISSVLASATDVHADDMNNDGRPDVLAWSFANGDLHLFLNNEDGSLNGSVIYNGSSSINDIKTGDLNRDGNKDIAFFLADGVADGIYRMLGNGDGTFQAAVEVVDVSNPLDIDLGDIDGDGVMDLVLTEDGVTWWNRNKGDGSFDTSIAIGTSNPVSKLALFDLENDGDLDIVHVGVGSFVNSLTISGGDGVNFTSFGLGTNPSSGSDETVVGDITGDGLDDWITGSFDENTVALDINQNAGSSVSSFEPFPTDINGADTYLSVNALDLADLDGDGDQELLVGFFNSDNVVIYVNDGSGDVNAFTSTEILSGQTDVASVTTTDLDLDGDLDIIIAREDGNVVWIESLGALAVTGIDQQKGASDDLLTLFGTGFDLDLDKNVVQVGGVTADVTNVTAEGTSLEFILPLGLSLGVQPVTVEVDGVIATLTEPFEVIAISQPTNVAVEVSGSTANLTWDVHPNAGVDSYNIWRDTSPTATTFLANSTTNSYEDSGLNEGTNYYYRVTAADGSEESGFSREVSAAIQNSSGTDVSGNLIENDAWTIAGSPYNIVGDVGVPSAFSLTIEPGVVVNYTGDFRILVFGEINVNGVESNPVTFNGNSAEGSKYMIEIRQTNLDNSNIDYTKFTGPQWSLMEGLPSDGTKNTGNLKTVGLVVSNTSITSNSNEYVADTRFSQVTFESATFEDVNIEGILQTVNLYPISFVNSSLTNVDFFDFNDDFDRTNLEIKNSRVNSSSFRSTVDVSIENSSISNSTLGSSSGQVFRLALRNSFLTGSSIYTSQIRLNNTVADYRSISEEFFMVLQNDFENVINNTSLIGSFNNGVLLESSSAGVQLSNVTFIENGIALEARGFTEGEFSVTGSNFLTTSLFHIENETNQDISAQSNYWDSNSATIIAGKILDSNDNLELGTVDISNRLTSHNLAAPISAPENVVQSDDGGGLDISWSANEESDVAGYRVHWGAFDGFEYKNVSDVGNVSSTNLVGLTLSDQVAVTAYDSDADGINDMTDGNESWYTVAATPPGTPVALNSSDTTVTSFTANWSEVDGATSYRLDVATDDLFANLVTGYNNLQVFGTLEQISGLNVNSTYFYRVRSENAAGVSANSNVIEALTFLFEDAVLTGIPGFNQGDFVAGDFDNDNDYDILIGGSGNSEGLVEIYQYNSGTYSTSTFDDALRQAAIYDFELTDFDSDGDIDILSGSEENLENRFSELYINSGSSFTEILDNQIPDPKVTSDPNYLWIDIDNNGTEDLVHTNEERIYLNDLTQLTQDLDINSLFQAGTFFDILNLLKGDYDSDGDLDILLEYNNESLQNKLAVLRNGPSNFEVIALSSVNESGSNTIGPSHWIDLNEDGFLDVLTVELSSGANNSLQVFIYDGSKFPSTPSYTLDLGDFSINEIELGDFDHDGDIDIFSRGFQNTLNTFRYLVNVEGVFVEQLTDQLFSSAEPTAFNPNRITTFDYDQDADLDVFVSLDVSANLETALIENKSASPNAVPAAPSNLNSSAIGGNVTLSWDKATDDTTPQDGLSYEIYIGTTSGNQDVRSPKSDLATGFRKIVGRGDIQGNSWRIKDLAVGTYYWSVQAIDASYAGGAFAAEQTFEVTANPKLTFSTDYDISQVSFVYESSLDQPEQIEGFNGLTFNNDGTKVFILDGVFEGRKIEQFSLSTPYDLTTSTYDNVSADLSAQFLAPNGIQFSPNGLKLFVSGVDDSNGPSDPELVYQYSLSSPYNISGLTVDGFYDFSTQQVSATGLEFSRDGSKMLVAGIDDPEINMYDLSAPFNITSGVSFNSVLDLSTQGNPMGVVLSPDGKSLLVANEQVINVFTVENDLTNTTFVEAIDISNEVVQTLGFEFSPDGKRFYLVDANEDSSIGLIHQFRLNSNIFSINEADNTIVDGKMIISLQDETFVNAGGVLTADTHYLTNIALTQQMAVSSDGSFVELTLSNPSNLTNSFTPNGEIAIDFTDAAFSTVGASEIEGSVDKVIGFGIREPIVVPNGLVGDYRFNNNVEDISGFDFDGRVDGSASLTYTADRFVSATSAIDVGQEEAEIVVDFPSNAFASGFTANLWINPQEVNDGGDGDNAEVLLALFGLNLQLRENDIGLFATTSVETSNSPIADQEWQMITYTISANDNFVIYVDGNQVLSGNEMFNQELGKITIVPNFPSIHQYDGLLDDIRFYNRTLNLSEIQAIFNAESQLSNEALITSFTISDQVSSSIDDTNETIEIVMSEGTDLSSLSPTIEVSAGATVNPTSGTAQNFNSSITYTVTAEDGTTTKSYLVTVRTLGQGLIAYYTFNGDPDDQSGNGYNMLLNGDTQLAADRFESADQSYQLDGEDDRLTNFDFDMPDLWTVSLWIYPFVDGRNLVSQHDNANPTTNAFQFGLNGNLGLELFSDGEFGSSMGGSSANNIITLNSWQQVAVKYDGATIFFFKDGALVGQTDGSREYEDISSLNIPITLGALGDGSGAFAGRMDEVRIYDVPLSNEQIEAIYLSEVPASNNTPTDINLNFDEIAEGQPIGTVVGQLSTSDADVSDTHTYSLVSGAGDTNNGSFSISGDQLLTAEVFDFDTQSNYNIRIQTDDGRENGTFQEAFSITILESTGERPTAINLTASVVDENSPVGTAVGSLSTTDPDDPENNDTYTYSIVGGASSQFSIQNGNELVTSVGLDFEAQTFYSITIRSLDPGNLFLDEDFSISVQNVNPQASDLVLSNSSIIEGVAAGSTIGNFQVEGTEGRSSYVYSVVGGGSEFGITGNELAIADGVSAGTYTIDVLAEDNSGPDQVQNSFDILVSAVNAATSVSFGTDVTNYRIIGLPTLSARVSSVFPDLAAGDAGETWRIVSYTSGDFSDLTPASTMNSGTGYWFLAAESTTIDLTSLTPIQGDEASIQLRPEWNLISNPFLASLNVSEAITFSIGEGLFADGDLSSLYAYNENVISSLDVLQGGWIRNRTGGTLTLRLPNPTATSTGRKAPSGRKVEESWYEDNASWQLIVHMQDGARSSNLGAVGMQSNASDGIDRTDLTGPPLIAENASFRLSDRNGLVRNFKPYTGEGKRWDFQITAPQHNSVTLSWDSNMINQLDQKLYLYDPSRNVSYNMSAINSMRLPADASFEVLYGDAVQEETIQIPVLMYPNPASEVLYVEFFLEGNQLEIAVELTIFDMLGREVRAETRSFAPNAFGSFELYNMDLPAGTYVLHVKYGGRNSQPQKLIIK